MAQSSEQWLKLKKKYINIPLTENGAEYWGKSGNMSALYPVLQLFARVIDAKHQYTRGHSTRVAILSKYIAERLQFNVDDILKIEVAGLLHDAGKVGVPTSILDKPGRPDKEEWKIIQSHPKDSDLILSKISSLSDIAEIAASHHERFDGKGYPKGLKGDEINILSQIISVADTFDAITSSRAYRDAKPAEIAYKIICEELGKQFNPDIGAEFLTIPPKYIYALFDMYEA